MMISRISSVNAPALVLACIITSLLANGLDQFQRSRIGYAKGVELAPEEAASNIVFISAEKPLPSPIEHFQNSDSRTAFGIQSLKLLRTPSWWRVAGWQYWKIPAHDEIIIAAVSAPFLRMPPVCITQRKLLI